MIIPVGDFTKLAEAPSVETQNLISAICEILQASPEADFRNILDTSLIRRAGNGKNVEYFSGQSVFWPKIAEIKKRGAKWVGPGVIIIIGCFGNKYALVHFRGSYFEVDLEGARPANTLFRIIGCGGALTLHVPHTRRNLQYII